MEAKAILSAYGIPVNPTVTASSAAARAVNEYNLAIRTKDDTQGAQEEASKYLKTAYERGAAPGRAVESPKIILWVAALPS